MSADKRSAVFVRMNAVRGIIKRLRLSFERLVKYLIKRNKDVRKLTGKLSYDRKQDFKILADMLFSGSVEKEGRKDYYLRIRFSF